MGMGMGMGMNVDPRMSMMGMPMGMPMGMGMGMGMNPQIGMQMTGGTSPGFDPRFSMGPGQMGSGGQFDGNLRPPSNGNFGPSPPTQFQRPTSFNGVSPAESPGPRPSDPNDEQPRRSDNASPRA